MTPLIYATMPYPALRAEQARLLDRKCRLMVLGKRTPLQQALLVSLQKRVDAIVADLFRRMDVVVCVGAAQ